ncbi:MAG: hypothetical protein Q9217_000140 [Psora testacea]
MDPYKNNNPCFLNNAPVPDLFYEKELTPTPPLVVPLTFHRSLHHTIKTLKRRAGYSKMPLNRNSTTTYSSSRKASSMHKSSGPLTRDIDRARYSAAPPKMEQFKAKVKQMVYGKPPVKPEGWMLRPDLVFAMYTATATDADADAARNGSGEEDSKHRADVNREMGKKEGNHDGYGRRKKPTTFAEMEALMYK